jgi:Family of unknown function (DUF5950)
MTQVVSMTDEIRQIQLIMILLLLAPSKGALSELFEKSLAASGHQVSAKLTPCTGASFDELKTWLESLLAHGDLTPEEQELVNWQNTPEKILAAIQELKTIQDKINLKFTIQTKS